MGTVTSIASAQHPPKTSQSRMETLILTPAMVNSWKLPEFQRELRVNERVKEAIAWTLRDQVIKGILTLGWIEGKSDQVLWIVDGQHRVEAFKLTGLEEVIADIRICCFKNMVEMSKEFVRLNSALVKMRPDDVLRGLESSVPALQQIRKACEFVGYGKVRRRTTSGPIVSMSALLRSWFAGLNDTPGSGGTVHSGGAIGLAEAIDPVSVSNLIGFLAVAHEAWSRDPENYKLWGNLNLTLCMWLWNRLVIDTDRTGSKRYAVINAKLFTRCLMSVAADAEYCAWLVGRTMGDRDRRPCYSRLKDIFSRRLGTETKGGRKLQLPQPAWASK